MVSFPPSSDSQNPDSQNDEHVAPVTFLQPRRPARERVAFTRFDDPDEDATFGGTFDEDGVFIEKSTPATTQRARVTKINGPTAADAVPVDVPEPDAQKARDRASKLSLDQLARRGMSRWELEQVLKKREIDDETIQQQLNRLEDVRLLDDDALARYLVSTLHGRKGLGSAAIRQELRRKHIPDYEIDSALDELDSEEEEAKAIELALKRIRQLSSYDDDTIRRRVHGFLSRKGYDGHTVSSAISVAMLRNKRPDIRFE
jgi:regulatory protein